MAKSGYYSKGAEIKVFNVMNPNGTVLHDMKTLLGPISIYEDLTDASIHVLSLIHISEPTRRTPIAYSGVVM